MRRYRRTVSKLRASPAVEAPTHACAWIDGLLGPPPDPTRSRPRPVGRIALDDDVQASVRNATNTAEIHMPAQAAYYESSRFSHGGVFAVLLCSHHVGAVIVDPSPCLTCAGRPRPGS